MENKHVLAASRIVPFIIRTGIAAFEFFQRDQTYGQTFPAATPIAKTPDTVDCTGSKARYPWYCISMRRQKAFLRKPEASLGKFIKFCREVTAQQTPEN
jgi:hypothetical protein